MKKPLSPSVYFTLCLCIIVLAAVFLILGPGENTGKKQFPVAKVVTTPTRGYNSSTTEQFMTDVLEKSLSKIPGVSHIESVSTGEGSFITVFSETADYNSELLHKIRDVVNESKRNLPQDILPPVITPLVEENIILYTVESHILSPADLRKVQEEEIVPEINTLSEVLYTTTLGGKQRVVRLCPDRYKLAAVGLDMAGVRHQLQVENVHVSGSGLQVRKNYRIDDLRNFAVRNEKGEMIMLEDFCAITDSEERINSFGGRNQEAGKVMGMIHYRPRENQSVEEARNKILAHLANIRPVSVKKVNILPFETGLPQKTTTYPSAKKAGIIGVVGILLMLLLSFFAALSWKKKTLLLTGTALFFACVVSILYAQQPISKNETIHLQVQTGMGLPGEEKEQLAWSLARKAQAVEQVQELLWYSGEQSGDPFENNGLHFYARLKPGVNYDQTLEQLYAVFNKIPGIGLTQFPSTEKESFISCKIKVKGRDHTTSVKALYNLRQKLGNMGMVKDLYTKGDEYQPMREYRLHNKVHLVMEDEGMMKMENDIPLKVGCLDANGRPVDEVLVRDMNQGGQLVRLQPVDTTVLAAIYHQDRERVYWVGFRVEEKMLDQVKHELQFLQVDPGVEISWEE